jgi:hypothetical protein
MSKAVRIREHLYAEIAHLAQAEHRSLIAQLEVLLEQALQLPENFDKPKIGPATETPRVEVSGDTIQADPHFKPDFK